MQITDFIPKHAAFIAAVILLFSSGSSQAENYSQNFDGFADGTTNIGDGTVIFGPAARVQGGRLQLTRDGEGLGHSSFTIPALENSSLGWTATWDFELFDASGEGNPADGFSFNYGNFVLGERGNAEEGMGINGGDQIPAGVTTNISFEVDTYNNGDPEQGVSISGVLNGTDPGNLAFTNGIILNDGQRVTGTMSASYDATLETVSFTTTGLNTNANFIEVVLPTGAVGDDTFNFGFSARVGGANQDLFIDNLEITTNPSLDSDNDGLPDSWEQRYGLDPNDNGLDPDENGLVNVDNGPDGDPDGDGVNNEDEFANKTNPVEEDTDSDGLNDGVEANTGTNPLLSDTDADGLNDGEEVFTHETNPNIFDSDGDGFSDGTEITLQTDPNDEDSAPELVTTDLSFPPLLGGPGARTNSYLPNLDEAGLSMQENHYNAEVLFNDQALQNYLRVALSPGDWPPNRTKTQVQPYFDHGGGGFNTPSGGNLPYIDGGGDHFSIRINGYVLFKNTGVYTIYLRADDTNFFLMDTPSGRIGANHNSIGGGDVLLTVNVSSPGYYPFDNVMAEQTGGDWGDVSITGPGIPQRAALGDVAAGSPAIYTIKFNPADTDNDLLPDWWEKTYTNNLDDLSGLIDSDLDGDTLTDFDEYENGTNPNNEDTDGDGLEDNVETNSGIFVSAEDTGTDPTNADTDGDGLNDNVETNTGVFLSATDTGTDPNLIDTDSDSFSDGEEVNEGGNPLDSNEIPPPLLIYYDFEGDAASTVTDKSDFGHNGVFSGSVTFSNEGAPAGPSPGGSASFTGGFINVAGLDMNQEIRDFGSGSYTMTCWLKPSDIAGEKFIFGQTQQGIHNGIRNDSFLHQAHWGADTNGSTQLGPYIASDSDGWIHAAFVYDGAANQGTIYLDGQQDWTGAKREPNGGGNFILGGRDNGQAEKTYQGLIDEVAVWRITLTAEEILALAEGGSPTGGTPIPLKITNVSANFSGESPVVTMSFNSKAGTIYAIDRTTDLLLWEELDDGLEGEADSTEFVDSFLPADARRIFYRVRQVE